MTRAKDISKIVTDANLSGTLDVTGAFTSQGIDDNADATAITIDSSERVGIGNSTPSSYQDGARNLVVGNTSDTGMTIASGTSNLGSIFFADGTSGGAKYEGQIRYNHGSNFMMFATGGSERMRISDGNVGINTSSPSETLDVAGDARATRLIGRSLIESSSGFSSDTFAVMGGNTSNASTSHGAVFFSKHVDSNALLVGTHDATFNSFAVKGNGNVGIGTTSPVTNLDVYGNINLRDGYNLTWGGVYGANIPTINATGGSGANIRFYPEGNTSGEAMRITNQSVGGGGHTLGDATVTGTGFNFRSQTNGAHLEIGHASGAGDGFSFLICRRAGTVIGGISQNGTTGVDFDTTSDYRLKENVTYNFDATTRLKQLQPCRFNFISEPNRTIDGFLAHEVADAVPQAIRGQKDAVDEDGNINPQMIDHSKLVPLLVKTIQELEARITALENGE